MEAFDMFGISFGIFGIVALVWCINLSNEVARLKRTIKESTGENTDKTSLKEILEKNIGKSVQIRLESRVQDYTIASQPCLLEDIDEDWVLVKTGKKDIEKLLRIESIRGINFK